MFTIEALQQRPASRFIIQDDENGSILESNIRLAGVGDWCSNASGQLSVGDMLSDAVDMRTARFRLFRVGLKNHYPRLPSQLDSYY